MKQGETVWVARFTPLTGTLELGPVQIARVCFKSIRVEQAGPTTGWRESIPLSEVHATKEEAERAVRPEVAAWAKRKRAEINNICNMVGAPTYYLSDPDCPAHDRACHDASCKFRPEG